MSWSPENLLLLFIIHLLSCNNSIFPSTSFMHVHYLPIIFCSVKSKGKQNKLLISLILKESKRLFFFSIWGFFQEHLRFTEQQEKREAISLIPLYHFHPLHRNIDISRAITAKCSSLHIASSRFRTRNLWNASR